MSPAPAQGGARAQVSRLLALVPYLNARDEVHLEDAARDFGVTPQTLLRDLQVLWFCGLPGLGPGEMIDIDMDAFDAEGDGKIRIRNAEYLDRPLRLGSSEASALVVALRAMREGSPEESRDAIDRALAKLEAATTEGQFAEVVEAADHLRATRAAASTLEQAIADGHQVRLSYEVPSRDETTERVVDPLAVLVADGRHYLDAWCHLVEARRLFRLDRMVDMQVTDQPVEVHDVEPRDLSEGLFEPGPDDLVATLRLARPVRWVADYYPVEDTRETDDGGLEVTLRVGDPQWLVRLLFRLAPHADLVAPADLDAAVRSAAARTLALYDAR